jgi:hypothetical protein
VLLRILSREAARRLPIKPIGVIASRLVAPSSLARSLSLLSRWDVLGSEAAAWSLQMVYDLTAIDTSIVASFRTLGRFAAFARFGLGALVCFCFQLAQCENFYIGIVVTAESLNCYRVIN